MVKEIKFDYWLIDFGLFAKYCPNLHSFFCDRSAEYFPILLAELKKGAWKKMNKIQHPTPGYSEEYAKIALELRGRLIEYTVYDEVVWGDNLVKRTHDKLVEHLASFPNLQSVEFLIREVKHIFEFDKYIDDCACFLNKVKVITICTKSDLENSDNNHFFNLTMPHRNNLSQIKQRPLVKQLHVEIVLASDDSLLYLMHKFPSLIDLQLNVSAGHTRQATLNRQISANLSLQTISSFLLYLCNIPRFNVSKFYMREACTLLPLPISAIATRIGAKCRFVIDYQNVHSTVPNYDHHPRVNISRSEQGKNIFLAVDIYPIKDRVELPHLYLLENTGQQVHHLELSMGPMVFVEEQWKSLLDENTSKMINGFYFSHLLKYCSQLTELGIKSCAILDCGFNSQMKHTNLKKLTFTNCVIYPGIFKDLSSQLPSLSYLDMDYCQFISKNENTDDEDNDYFALDIPDTHFQYLRWGIRCDKYSGFCLRLVDGTGTEAYFKGKIGKDVRKFHQKGSAYHPDGYHASRQFDKVATIDIHCADVKKLEICINYTDFQIDCTK